MPIWNNDEEAPRIPNELRGNEHEAYHSNDEGVRMNQDSEPKYIRRKIETAWRRIEYLKKRIDEAHRETGRKLHHDAQELSTWYWLLRVAEHSGYDTTNPNKKEQVN